MLATIIADAFRKEEAQEIAAALDALCSPTSSYGWSSAGIYSFWNPDTKRILYVGLAVDLPQRFRQHTGLLPCDLKGCKLQQIGEYFASWKYLGYSIFVQSTLSQPLNARYVRKLIKGSDATTDEIWEKFGESEQQGHEEIKLLEGWLIEICRKLHQQTPWNKVGGSRRGQKVRYTQEEMILSSLTASHSGLLLARSTLRTLASNELFEAYEEVLLHAVRLGVFRLGLSVEMSINMLSLSGNTDFWSDMVRTGYLDRVLELPGGSSSRTQSS